MAIQDQDLKHLLRDPVKVRELERTEEPESAKVMAPDLERAMAEIQGAVKDGMVAAAMAQVEEDRELAEGDRKRCGPIRLNKERGSYSNRSHNTRRKLAAIRSPAP